MTETGVSASPSKVLWTVLQFTLPLILAVIAGYGSVKYSTGEQQQKLLEFERRISYNSERIERLEQGMISKAEWQFFIETTRSDLGEIKTDIRELRRK